MTGPESFGRIPKLPEGVLASRLQEEASEKEMEAMARAQGISLVAFKRFVNEQAKQERIIGYVTKASDVLSQKSKESVGRDENMTKTEESVIRGLEYFFASVERKMISPEEIESIENEAYALAENADQEKRGAKRAGARIKAKFLFMKAIRAEVLREIHEKGNTKEVREEIAERLRERSTRSNIRSLGEAISEIRRELVWGNLGNDHEALKSLINAFRSGTLTIGQRALLQSLAKFAKTTYIAGHWKNADDELLKDHGDVLNDVSNAYRKYGPHKKTNANVSGPSEVFDSHQSDRVSGYRSDSKRRPHRDPSGGNGEKY